MDQIFKSNFEGDIDLFDVMKLNELDPKEREESLFLIRRTFIEAYLLTMKDKVTEDEMQNMPDTNFEETVKYFQSILSDHDDIFRNILSDFKKSMLDEAQIYDSNIPQISS
ncbi:hypothetical protein M1145_02985 [Patescibacteria group bacterium]|nr:hypothetical protein [Patescibacteria group bacterium]